MSIVLITVCLLGQPSGQPSFPPFTSRTIAADQLRDAYAEDAAKYVFRRADGQELKLVDKPIMRWSTDNDWSGDVFAWTYHGRPEVVGCILSGPRDANRFVYHEFHSLATQPLASTDLATRRRWQPKEGLALKPISGAPPPADEAKSRITQMRRLARRFTAKMEADGEWELRLLTQPLLRYEAHESDVVDGALFGYVWTTGTDLEVILLLECRKTSTGLAWFYAPLRFSTRSVWLDLDGTEVWRVEGHREPSAASTDLIYTTAYAGLIKPLEASGETPAENDTNNTGSR